jgi:hypothetical protein
MHVSVSVEVCFALLLRPDLLLCCVIRLRLIDIDDAVSALLCAAKIFVNVKNDDVLVDREQLENVIRLRHTRSRTIRTTATSVSRDWSEKRRWRTADHSRARTPLRQMEPSELIFKGNSSVSSVG